MAAGSAAGGDARRPVLVLTGPTGAGKTDWAIALAAARAHRDRQRGFRARVPRPGYRHGQAARGAARARSPPPDRHLRAHRELFGGAIRHRCPGAHSGDPRPRPHPAAGRRHDAVSARAAAGLAVLPQAAPALRQQLDARARRVGWPALHAELAQLDPQAAARISPADSAAHPAGTRGVPEHRAPDLRTAARHGQPARRTGRCCTGCSHRANARNCTSGSRSGSTP